MLRIVWRRRKIMILRRRRRTDHKTAPRGLRERAQSKCTWTCHKSHFIWKFTGECRGPDWAQNVGTHFVRACAVEMHVHMSQETSEKPLYTEIYRKNVAAPERGHTLCLHLPPLCQVALPWLGKSNEKRWTPFRCII
jgi:hypothetical protein